MKKTLLLIILWSISILGNSAPIDLQQALKNSEKFLTNQKGVKAQIKLDLCYTGLSTQKSNEEALFYIFTSKENNAFVIASADDRISPILAYSTEGDFQLENMPENLSNWLLYYQNSIPTLLEKGEVASISKDGNRVLPLLRDMAWNQNSPFNDLAPFIGENRAASGCVATAMAQIMRYHRWPVKGKGTVSYITKTHEIPILQNLGDKPFNWDNMPGIYSATSTSTQRAAVAQLVYYAGVSVKMNYDNSSGAYSSDVPAALVNNFGYSVSTELLYRDFFDYTSWAVMITSELDAGRPVYYSGASPEGGHAFVCDGYDENGLFHINWGWGGSSNGYFSLLEMNPSAQGIGAGGGGGYINGQSIIIGIKPSQEGDIPSKPYFAFDNISTNGVERINKTESTTITLIELYNYGTSTFNGSLGLALYSEAGEFSRLLTEKNDVKRQPFYGFKQLNFTATFTSVPVGKYYLRLVSKLQSSEEWLICRSYNGTPGYIEVDVTDTEAIFAPFSHPTLALVGELTMPAKIYAGKRTNFSMVLKNNGNTEYSSKVGLKGTTDKGSSLLTSSKVIIPAGASQTVQFSVDKVSSKAEEVTLDVVYDIYNGTSGSEVLSGIITSELLSVIASNSEQASVPTVESFTIDKAEFAVGETFTLNASMKSSDAENHFEAPIIIFIFNASGGTSVGYLNYDKNFSLAPNATIDLNIPSSLYLTSGDYKFAFFYMGADKKWAQMSGALLFTLTNHENPLTDPTDELSSISIYPNPATDFIAVKGLISDKFTIDLINVQGQKVLSQYLENNMPISINHLTKGIYIALVSDMNGTIIKRMKIVKQ